MVVRAHGSISVVWGRRRTGLSGQVWFPFGGHQAFLARLMEFKLTCQLTFELSLGKKLCWGWRVQLWLHVWLLGVVGEWKAEAWRAAVVTFTWSSSKIQRREGLCGACRGKPAMGGEESQRGLQIANKWVSSTITLSNGRWQSGQVWAAGPVWEAQCSEPSLFRW